ncbi:MarR family winged helix-turn-helix transcriptional regulator [Sphingomonas sp. PB2P19]|uniref:MarR family winged helix-turn-helix transcriptional regulator n=1 Tax=Sphingomonas rhamnosi TaxID=3096156 RepID=UPI002FCA001F
MTNDTVFALMKELTTKLSAVAGEYDDRLAEIVRPIEQAEDSTLGPAELNARATALLAERRLRRQHLPPELFHEPAWDMLLALFVARDDDMPMNIKALVAMADAPVTTSQRWIEHLYKLRLIDRVIDPTDRRRVEISLSETGLDAVANYLRAIARAE